MRITSILVISILAFVSDAMIAQVPVYKVGDLLRRISHPDTLYVVNFWATWCKPCIKELPALDSLQAATKHTNVKVLLVSLDFPEDLSTRVVPFLQKKKVLSSCVLLDEVNGNDFIDRIDSSWSGAIPATLMRKSERSSFAERPLHLADLQRMAEKTVRPE